MAGLISGEIGPFGADRLEVMAHNIGERILECRSELELNRSEVARAIGVTPTTIRNLETGASHTMEAENLIALADFFKVNIRWLASGKGEKRAKYDPLPISERAQQIAFKFDRLTDEGQSLVAQQVDLLTGK